MKEGMCKGCDNLTEAAASFWINEGTPEAEPLTMMMPFCDEYCLHLRYIEEIIAGDEICFKYKKEGVT